MSVLAHRGTRWGGHLTRICIALGILFTAERRSTSSSCRIWMGIKAKSQSESAMARPIIYNSTSMASCSTPVSYSKLLMVPQSNADRLVIVYLAQKLSKPRESSGKALGSDISLTMLACQSRTMHGFKCALWLTLSRMEPGISPTCRFGRCEDRSSLSRIRKSCVGSRWTEDCALPINARFLHQTETSGLRSATDSTRRFKRKLSIRSWASLRR